MLTLIENGEIYAPEPRGRGSVLIFGGRVARVGEIDARAVEALGLELSVIDATGCLVTPGLIDPHEHLTGGSGEKGFSTQTPEIFFSELVGGGITTVVGCLGLDTTTKTMPGLLARAKALREEGLTAFLHGRRGGVSGRQRVGGGGARLRPFEGAGRRVHEEFRERRRQSGAGQSLRGERRLRNG
jgi:beta-aspartyl-dipeptidase (metallo-type)